MEERWERLVKLEGQSGGGVGSRHTENRQKGSHRRKKTKVAGDTNAADVLALNSET